MTGPDRTDELVRAMLDRRSGGTMPDWLLDATMNEVVRSRQSRGRSSSWSSWAGDSRMLLVAVVALAALALASALAVGAFLQRDANPLDPPVAVADVSPTVEGSDDASAPIEQASASPTTGEPADDEPPTPTAPPPPTTKPDSPEYPNGIDVESPITVGALALVTLEGDRLRVRSRPGLGEDSERLTPLLPASTNVFVFDGPVTNDGYDWYQGVAYGPDFRLFGWMAGGDERNSWLQSSKPVCSRELSSFDVIERPAAEYLVCFGDEPVTVKARVNHGLGPVSEGNTEEDYACPQLAEGKGCDLTRPWLQVPLGGILFQSDDTEWVTEVAVPPGLEERFYAAPVDREVAFTIAMDSPEAQECRVVDRETGNDHITPAEAVARCRMTFVLQDMDW